MKLFSLISGKEVRIAPGQKTIPAEDFSILQSAKELLTHVEEEIEELKKKTATEAEEEKKAGFEKGFQEGLESFNQHLFALVLIELYFLHPLTFSFQI